MPPRSCALVAELAFWLESESFFAGGEQAAVARVRETATSAIPVRRSVLGLADFQHAHFCVGWRL